MKLKHILPTLALLFCGAIHASAVLQVSGGVLIGAKGVDVGGQLYDVTFLDGTCAALFDGCDQQSDFTFQTVARANLAAKALIDQVFLDTVEGQFDSMPGLTRGCGHVGACFALVPWTLIDTSWDARTAMNFSASGGADSLGGSSGSTSSLATSDLLTFAVFTLRAQEVPEPTSILLMGLGILVMAAVSRRQWR